MAKKSDVLKDLRRDFEESLVQVLKLEPKTAQSVAGVCADTVRLKWGGDNIYVPKEDHERLTERDWKMWEQFNGSNIDQVARAFDMTVRQAYNRLSIIRPIAFAREQRGLFDEVI